MTDRLRRFYCGNDIRVLSLEDFQTKKVSPVVYTCGVSVLQGLLRTKAALEGS
jgi:hypothetical protein